MKGKATRLDVDFEVPDEWKSYPRERNWSEVSIERQAQDFADHHVSKGTKHVAWIRSWQLWCRRAEDYKNVEFGVNRTKVVGVGHNMTAEELDKMWFEKFGVARLR